MNITKGLNLFPIFICSKVFTRPSPSSEIDNNQKLIRLPPRVYKTWKSSCFGKQLYFNLILLAAIISSQPLPIDHRLTSKITLQEILLCMTTRRWFLDRVSHCSSVFWHWPAYPEPSRKIPASSQSLLTQNRVLWWTITAVWRQARATCWRISKLQLILSLQSPAKVFYIFNRSVQKILWVSSFVVGVYELIRSFRWTIF